MQSTLLFTIFALVALFQSSFAALSSSSSSSSSGASSSSAFGTSSFIVPGNTTKVQSSSSSSSTGTVPVYTPSSSTGTYVPTVFAEGSQAVTFSVTGVTVSIPAGTTSLPANSQIVVAVYQVVVANVANQSGVAYNDLLSSGTIILESINGTIITAPSSRRLLQSNSVPIAFVITPSTLIQNPLAAATAFVAAVKNGTLNTAAAQGFFSGVDTSSGTVAAAPVATTTNGASTVSASMVIAALIASLALLL